MADVFMQRVPRESNWTAKDFNAKSRQAMRELEKRVALFQRSNALNTYKIAQMANTFKWTLRDAGYEHQYVDDLTQWLVERVR
ncbi:hypothetical protein [Pseudorhodoferax sp. Leaf267]|uniref:hypothetical protein n=1 Tax=Pseudorhodoferax sp. Leaf267 TaxID=1736316 RepID=UPI000700B8E8|nr:hypothetical protein [Pseudorhodoferax sp. Leaf267]KQP12720.1 hypothetical protein ASF43_21090 [Pseudorhodoferax sp. Leaf267]